MIDEREDFIDSKFSIHDKHRFEVKLDIALKQGKKSSFKIEYFFFIPSSLNILPQNYTKELFYADTQHYIRFKTPSISLEKLFYINNELSPYTRIIQELDKLISGNNSDFIVETIIDEIKLLGCIVRAEIRDLTDFFINSIKDIDSQRLKELLIKFKTDIKIAIDSIENLKTKILTSNVDVKIKEAFLMMDEYINLVIEEYLINLIEKLKQSKDKKIEELISEFSDIAISRHKYRVSMGYKSVLVNGTFDDHFIYHRSMLKKFVSSALYLMPETGFNIVSHMAPALAAGVAMLFAILVTIYAQTKYAMKSIDFIFIIVISYIFKDRIKDWLKVILSQKMWDIIYDKKINVREPTHNLKLGYIKETFSFLPSSMVPSDILRIRNIDNKKEIEEDVKQERIFKYRKEVEIDPDEIIKYHERRKDLIDIVRFSIIDFIKQADDEFVDYKIIDENKEIKDIKCMRIYHINVVIKYCFYEDTKYERIRILVTKNGILKLQEVKI